MLTACSTSLPHGPYGPYSRRTKHISLPSGETLVVYRLKYWTFRSPEPPAIQLEYEAPFAVSDTAAVQTETRVLWPFFVPYLEAKGVTAGIITATNLHILRLGPITWMGRTRSYGLVAHKGSDGVWRLETDSLPLPAADTSRLPRILDADGTRMRFDVPYPVDSGGKIQSPGDSTDLTRSTATGPGAIEC